MRSKFRFLGIIALIAVIGLVFTACGDDDDENNNSNGNNNGTSLNIEMVQIPAGTFKMGSPETEIGRISIETQWDVTLTGFKMSKYQVTQDHMEGCDGK